jgi:hypothetical protein
LLLIISNGVGVRFEPIPLCRFERYPYFLGN